MSHDVSDIASRFQLPGPVESTKPYGTGHINDTYASEVQTENGTKRFIHQRINHSIFKDPPKVMENILRVTEHIRGKVLAAGGDPSRRTLQVIPAKDSRPYYQDAEGNYWRTYVFIEGAKTYDVVENLDHVYAASRAFGQFQKMISDLPDPRLHETIVDFHNTRWRFGQFRDALENDTVNRAVDAKEEIDFVLQREQDASVLVDLLEQGRLPERIAHNDTKLNNVMIDDATGEGICVIDLDTVMPGLPMYDFGDSIRIGAATAAEDEQDLSKVHMDLDMFDRLAHGYLDEARDFLVDEEVRQLAFSAKLLTFECGMRFLTDHLNGDTYFKVHRENHNLDRCRTQFKMVAEMEQKREEMEALVEKYRG